MSDIKKIRSISDITNAINKLGNDFEKIKELLEGRGDINVRLYDGNFIQLNYNFEAEMNNRWNWLEKNSRGMIFDIHDGSCVARPFAKFFNWGQRQTTTKAEIEEVLIKEDGSCGITFYDKYKDKVRVATRGSLESDQAVWATQWLNDNLYTDKLKATCSHGFTPIFEIVYPENRIVVDYKGYKGLILLAVRNIEDGKYESHESLEVFAEDFDSDVVELISGKSVEDILEELKTLPMNSEGYVVTFKDGLRAKFKGLEYLHAHRLISDLSQKRVNELFSIGPAEINEYLHILPDEFHDEFNGYLDNIENITDRLCSDVFASWNYVKNLKAGAEFGKAVQAENIEPYLKRILFDWKKGTKNWSSDEIKRYIASKQK